MNKTIIDSITKITGSSFVLAGAFFSTDENWPKLIGEEGNECDSIEKALSSPEYRSDWSSTRNIAKIDEILSLRPTALDIAACIYLDWTNNYLTVDRYAEANCFTTEFAELIICAGKKAFNTPEPSKIDLIAKKITELQKQIAEEEKLLSAEFTPEFEAMIKSKNKSGAMALLNRIPSGPLRMRSAAMMTTACIYTKRKRLLNTL
jgi:hypothetical protein